QDAESGLAGDRTETDISIVRDVAVRILVLRAALDIHDLFAGHPAYSPRGLEAGQLPAGGFGSTIPGFGQVRDGDPRRSGWVERKGRRRFVPVFVHGALQQLPGFPEDHGAWRAGLGLALL